MAQWNKTTQDYLNQERTLHEVYLRADEYGNILNESACSKSAFGENISIPITPKIQADAVYGLDPREFETFTFSATGIATHSNSTFVVGAGSSANSYGVIRSTNFIRYRPGQGVVARFTGSFSNNPVGFTQRAGLFNQEQAIQIGYAHTNGKFGVLRANGGKARIQGFDFTTLDDGNVTVTLNGTSFTAVTVNSGTLAGNLSQLAQGLRAQALFNALWLVEYDQSRLRFLATSLGPQLGTFNLTSTAAASFTNQIEQAGVVQTENWTFQEDFNLDKLDGTGYSGITLDPSKLNVYQINFRWLGSGEIRYAIENPLNGDMIFFHHEHYSNRNELPHLANPSMKIGYVAANINGGVGVVTCRGASFLGAIEGIVERTRLPYSITATRNDSMNTPGSLYHLLSVKNKLVYQGKINTRDLIISRLTASVNTVGDPAVIRLYYNPTIANYLRWTTQGDFNTSLTATQDSTGLFALGAQSIPPIAAFHVADNSTLDVNLIDMGIHIPPNNFLTAVISSTSNITAANVSFIYVED
jgi:hypothetical protein